MKKNLPNLELRKELLKEYIVKLTNNRVVLIEDKVVRASDLTYAICQNRTRIDQRFYVYEKIIQDKEKPIKGNALVKDEVISKIYDSSSSAMTHIIKSIKKYCPKRAHEFIIFS